MTRTQTGVKTLRPTRGVRRGLRVIADVIIEDFDNAFERLFPSATERTIMDVMEALNWLEQYAEENNDEIS